MALFKLKEIKKVKRVEIRLSAAEKELLENEVDVLNMDLSDYLLKCAFNRAVHKYNTTNVGVNLMRITAIQRDIWQKDKTQEPLQRLILNAVGDAFSDLPDRLGNKIPQLYLPAEPSKKESRISMRLTEDEWISLRKKAEENQKTVSEYILLKALNRPKSPALIRKIAGQLSEFEKMLNDLTDHSLLKSPIYLTIQKELLEYLKAIPQEFHNDCYVRTESRLSKKVQGRSNSEN